MTKYVSIPVHLLSFLPKNQTCPQQEIVSFVSQDFWNKVGGYQLEAFVLVKKSLDHRWCDDEVDLYELLCVRVKGSLSKPCLPVAIQERTPPELAVAAFEQSAVKCLKHKIIPQKCVFTPKLTSLPPSA